MKKRTRVWGIILTLAIIIGCIPMGVLAETSEISGDIAKKPKYMTVNYNTANTAWDKANDYVGYSDDAKTGDYSLNVNVETALVNGSIEGNRYISLNTQLNDGMAFEDGAKYRMTYWAKSEEVGTIPYHAIYLGWNYARASGDFGKQTTDDGWTRCYYDFQTSAGTAAENVFFIFSNNINILIDDISLKKVTYDGETEILGDEMIKDGSFDEYVLDVSYAQYDETGLTSNSYVYTWQSATSHTAWAKPTAKYARSGDYGLWIYRNSVPENDRVESYLTLSNGESILLEAGKTYGFEVWANGLPEWGTSLMISLSDNPYCDVRDEYKTYVEKDDKGWMRFYKEFTPSGNTTPNWIVKANYAGNYVIDDFRIFDVENPNVNLVPDGGFENVTYNDILSLINPMAAPSVSGTGATVSWQNPDNSEIEDLKIYVDGAVVEDFVADKTANAFNQYFFADLIAHREYAVKVVATISGKSYTYNLTMYGDGYGSNVPHLSNHQSDYWKITRRENLGAQPGYYSNIIFDIDNDEKAEGISSLRIDANMNKRHTRDNYQTIYQNVELNKNKRYKLSFKYKYDFNNAIVIVREGYQWTGVGALVWNEEGTKMTSDWIEYTADFSEENYNPTASATDTYIENLRFDIECLQGSFWIDDVQVKEYDEDYEMTVGENLLSDAGFEFAPYVIDDAEFNLITGTDEEPQSEAITALAQGKVEVVAGIKNISAGDDFGAAVFAVLYNGNKVEDVQPLVRETIAELPYHIPADKVKFYFDIPALDSGEYKIKVMYLDNLGTIKPIGEYDLIEEPKA